jgi:hypothetical protein
MVYVRTRVRGNELPLNRQEAVLLLKELASVCSSFQDAQSVSIEKDTENKGWELHINCTPLSSEINCIEKILANHSLEMATIKGYSVFRPKK